MPLAVPVTAVAVERSAGALGRAAVAAMQGVRPNFEDAHVLDQSLGICGVFDGHLGDEAAAFVAERLHLHVCAMGTPPTPEAFLAAFAACDAEMKTALPEGAQAGSTATLAVVSQNGDADNIKVRVASCGDSRAVLWHKSSGSFEATRDHRPSDHEERKRIEAAGGTVIDEFDPPRVDGQLACSRALGAFKFKQGSGGPAEQKVTCVPEVYDWHAQTGDWLIIACDGVWDTFSSQKVIDEVCVAMTAQPTTDLGDLLARTLKLCIDKEADDNLTLLAVELGAKPQEQRLVSMLPGDFLKTKDAEVLEQYTSFCRRFGFLLQKETKPKMPPAAALCPTDPQPALVRFPGLAAPVAATSLTAAAVIDNSPGKVGRPNRLNTGLLAATSAQASMKPLVICGPSGVGKGTLITKLMEAFPRRFGFSVSHTTRQPRDGEEEGKHYHFVDLEQMKRDVEHKGKFIEHALVHGNLYGTSTAAVSDVQKQGRVCILDIDVQGVKQIKDLGIIDANYMFVTPPEMYALEHRLRGRGTESEEKIQKRLSNARDELEFCEKHKDMGITIVNADLGIAVKKLLQAVREWYPSLMMRMKVATRRPPNFYVHSARQMFAGRVLTEEERAMAPDLLEVVATGKAIESAAAVFAALVSDGHVSVLEETDMIEVEDSNHQMIAMPRIRFIMRRAGAVAKDECAFELSPKASVPSQI